MAKKLKNKCDHFWELVLPVENWNRPKWKCMKCPATKRDSIPILDIEESLKEDDKNDSQ